LCVAARRAAADNVRAWTVGRNLWGVEKMLTSMVVLLACAAPAEAPNKVERAPEPKAGAKAPKVLARAAWKGSGDKPQQQVIRSADELAKFLGMAGKGKEATGQLARQLKVDEIDWKKQMVVVVTAGVQRTGGYSVEVTNLEVKDKTLSVRWKLNSPRPGGFVIQVLTHPGQAVLVERFDGKLNFLPAAKLKEKSK
jgi:hypothetical protein